MMAAAAQQANNHLLEQLPRAQRDAVTSECESVDLVFGEVLCEPRNAYRHVYFPLDCCISLMFGVSGHRRLEIGMIGNEGMLGASVLLNPDEAPLRAKVQAPGAALRMPVARFLKILKTVDGLPSLLGRFLFVQNAQIAQTVACIHFHEVKPRLVRWLLMMHDRTPCDDFYLTHEFLSDMLGVQRSAVSIAAHSLLLDKLIHYSRGQISVTNREGLEAMSCECYSADIEAYERTLTRVRPQIGYSAEMPIEREKAGFTSLRS